MIVTLLTPLKIPMAYEEPDDSGEIENEESFPYPKLDDLMKELKDKRKQIEQQRLEEIKAKKLEQGELIDESAEEGKDDKKDTEKNKEKEVIPSLIVRLRGKHSTKYLCSYSFTEVENNSENHGHLPLHRAGGQSPAGPSRERRLPPRYPCRCGL